MAQEYNEILPGGSTNILQDAIDSRKNDETLRSGFSGSAFPTSPVPLAGQRCYREDLKKEYIFNGEGWVEVASSGAIAQEVALARGTHTELQDRLSVSMNPDGTLKMPATANVDEFKVSGLEPTYVSTNSFSVPGDVRAIFTENRRLKITQGAEIIYPAVVSASYDDVADKTTIVIDNITITTEIAAVDFSMVQSGLPANLNAATLNGKSDTAFQAVAEKDQPGGYAGLDATGKIPDELLNITDPVWGSISGTLADQEDLQTALDGKSPASHTHNDLYYTETEIDTALAGKANTSHSHSYAPIPSSSSLPVGMWCFCYNNATSDIANGGTIAGSNLKIFRLSLESTDAGANSSIMADTFEAGSLSGTWKNITGTTVKKYHELSGTVTRHSGLFVRIA